MKKQHIKNFNIKNLILQNKNFIKIKRILVILSIVILSVTSSFAQYGSLKGKITEKGTNNAISEAYIHLVKDEKVTIVMSSNDGTYYIKDIPVGHYFISSYKGGYFGTRGMTELDIKKNEETELNLQLVLYLQKATIVSGKVTDNKTNEGIFGVYIILTQNELTSGANSAFDGTYKVTPFISGTAQVKAGDLGYFSIIKTMEIKEGENLTLDFKLELDFTQSVFATTYPYSYNNDFDFNDRKDTVLLQYVAVDTDINMPTISGKITDEDTYEKIIGANLIFSKNKECMAAAKTNFYGMYEIKHIPAGIYDVSIFDWNGYDSKNIIVEIKEGEDTILDFQLEKTLWADPEKAKRVKEDNLSKGMLKNEEYFENMDYILEVTNLFLDPSHEIHEEYDYYGDKRIATIMENGEIKYPVTVDEIHQISMLKVLNVYKGNNVQRGDTIAAFAKGGRLDLKIIDPQNPEYLSGEQIWKETSPWDEPGLMISILNPYIIFGNNTEYPTCFDENQNDKYLKIMLQNKSRAILNFEQYSTDSIYYYNFSNIRGLNGLFFENREELYNYMKQFKGITIPDEKTLKYIDTINYAALYKLVESQKSTYMEPIDFMWVQDKPWFPNGQEDMKKFIKENIIYPKAAKKRGIQGRVFVQFTIEKNGNITNVNVIKSTNPLLNKEAIRVIYSMPKWEPGRHNGEVVSVRHKLPVDFKIETKSKQ